MASYNPPNPYVPGAFNPTQFITPSDNITTKFLDENYLRFPFAQGVENFVSINNQGSLNQGGLADFSSNTTPAIFNLPPTITNPIANTATTPLNAVATIGYVLANEQGGGDLLPLDNDWTGVNNFNPTPLQTYGSSMAEGLTITNNQSNSGTGLGTQLISYTPTGTIGFAIYSLASSSNTLSTSYSLQLKPDGVSSVLQAQGANGIAELNASGTGGKIILQASTGVKLQISPTINFNDWGTLSATSSSSGITSSVNLTAPTLTTGNMYFNFGGVSNGAQFQPTNVGGLNILATTLNLSNPTGGATTNTIFTPQVNNLDISNTITLPTQTAFNPATTYGNVASTQAFVQSAITQQGGGDVYLAGTNPFTGINTFNVNVPTSTIAQTSSSPNTQFSTIGLVKSLISSASPEINSLTFVNIGAPNIDPMTPTTVSAQVIYNPGSNTAQFISCDTFYTTQNNSLGGAPFCQIQFNIKPWSAFPPPNFSSTINTYCSTTGSVYNCKIYWGSSGSVYTMNIQPPNTLTYPVPATFTINLMNMGIFPG